MNHYENHNLDNTALPFIFRERLEYQSGMHGTSNWHENVEVLLVLEGDGTASNNGVTISVHPGDILVFNHNDLHSIAAGNKPLRHVYLIVDRSFCIANGFDTSEISFDMHLSDTRVAEYMMMLKSAYENESSLPYRTLFIRSTVLSLMHLLCTEYSHREQNAESSENTISYVKNAIAYIKSSYDKDFSLEDVASFVGINKCYLSREFHKYTGYPLVAYVNRTRCIMACELLSDGRLGIAEVGKRCGFRNKSYFAKKFKLYTAVLPCEYRKKIAMSK